MFVFIRKNFIATTVVPLSLPYTCEHCGHATTAEVFGIGTGSAEAPFLIGQDDARGRAQARADAAVAGEARLALGVTGCPRCHRRARRAERDLWLSSLVSALPTWPSVIGTVVGGLAIATGVMTPSAGILAAGLALFAIPLALAALVARRRYVRDASSRVTWAEQAA